MMWSIRSCAVPLIAALLGCSTIEGDWDRAVSADDVWAYRFFLMNNPQSRYTSEAQSRIDALVWKSAQRSNQVSDYESYLSGFPSGRYRQEAQVAIQAKQAETSRMERAADEAAWTSALRANTLQAYAQYRRQFRQGAHTEEASIAFKRLFDSSRLYLELIGGSVVCLRDGQISWYIMRIDFAQVLQLKVIRIAPYGPPGAKMGSDKLVTMHVMALDGSEKEYGIAVQSTGPSFHGGLSATTCAGQSFTSTAEAVTSATRRPLSTR